MAKPGVFLPLVFKVNVDDTVAVREGVQAARNIVSGRDLADQLKVGRLCLIGHKIALRHAGLSDNLGIGRHGRGYNEAFAAWLMSLPTAVGEVSEDDRIAAMKVCFNWHIAEPTLQRLDDAARQRLRVRGLWEKVEREMEPRPPLREPRQERPRPDDQYARLFAMVAAVGLRPGADDKLVLVDEAALVMFLAERTRDQGLIEAGLDLVMNWSGRPGDWAKDVTPPNPPAPPADDPGPAEKV
jgi:hypothetical protein